MLGWETIFGKEGGGKLFGCADRGETEFRKPVGFSSGHG